MCLSPLSLISPTTPSLRSRSGILCILSFLPYLLSSTTMAMDSSMSISNPSSANFEKRRMELC